MNQRKFAAFLRNFIFGVEDSLVSTVGLLSGIAVADVDRSVIIVTGVVLIFVEAFSMSVGSYLSEHSAEKYIKSQGEEHSEHSLGAAVIMFFSYFVSGFIPLLPYAIKAIPLATAFWASIALSIISLFVLGVIGARMTKENPWKSALRMGIVGGIAIALGVAVGQLIG